MITIIIDIGIAICGMFFGMALFSKILRETQREESEKYKNALKKIKERVQLSLNKADSYIILKIINEALDKNDL